MRPLFLTFLPALACATYHSHLRALGGTSGALADTGAAVPSDGAVSPDSSALPHVEVFLGGEMKQRLDAWLSHVFSDDPEECALETAAVMKELRYAYTARLVPSVLRDECEQYLYYERFGRDADVCHAIVEHLINTWRGDKDYEAWCVEAYGRRGTAKNSTEIPVKEDPGPRKGKYADVKEYSFPNDADPSKSCHGVKPCWPHRSGAHMSESSPSGEADGAKDGQPASETTQRSGVQLPQPLMLTLVPAMVLHGL